MRMVGGLLATLLCSLAVFPSPLCSVARADEPKPEAPAAEASVSALLARLQASADQVQTLAGEFTQQSRIKLFKQELSSTGRLYFSRPRRIRWQYLTPDPSTMVLDGDRATLTSPGAAPQVFDLTKDAAMRAVFDQIVMWIGGQIGASGAPGSDGGLAGYALSVEGGAREPVLVLQPKAGTAVAKTFQRIELHFAEPTKKTAAPPLLLRRILLREVSGDEKDIRFIRMEPNAKLPADAFAP